MPPVFFNRILYCWDHCELITADTLAALRNILPSCKIAQWWVDPFDSHSLPHLLAKQPELDAFFATTAPAYYEPLMGGDNSPTLYYLPNIVDTGIETERSFAGKKHAHDVFLPVQMRRNEPSF